MGNRLTKEQLEAARCAMDIPMCDAGIERIATHVQYKREPIAPPTDEELDAVYEAAHRSSKPVGMAMTCLEFALGELFRRRNSPPDPPDPLKSALEECKRRLDAKDYEVIIAAVKESGK
jgi:hypothetical protein